MDWLKALFDSWGSLARIVLVGVPLYLLLLVMLQGFGKHALAKSNAYGFVVTVSLGSAVASSVLGKNVSLSDAVLAIGLLLGLQSVLEYAGSHWRRAARYLNQTPALLLKDGRILDEALRRERVSQSEVLAAVRKHGVGCIEQIAAVVLEEDGSFSVIRDLGPQPSALVNVHDVENRDVSPRELRERAAAPGHAPRA